MSLSITSRPSLAINQIQYETLLAQIKHLEDHTRSTSTSTIAQLSSFQDQITDLNLKHSLISSQVVSHKTKIEKIDDFASFIAKAKDTLTTHEVRINTATKDIADAKYKYDKVIVDNLLVPGFIGDYCQYKNLREYLDLNIKEMSALNSFKQKNELDLKAYKERLEAMMKDFQRQIGLFTGQQRIYSEAVKKEAFEYIDQCRKDFYEKYDEIMIVNSKYAFELRDKASKMQAEWEKVLQIRNEVNAKIDKTLEEMKSDNKKTLEIFKANNTDFTLIKSKFAEMVEFIKDVRFRKNISKMDVVKKREISKLTSKLLFKKKKNKEEVEDKELDLKYDVFTGKEVQSSDDMEEEGDGLKDKGRGYADYNDNVIQLSPSKRKLPKIIKEDNENSGNDNSNSMKHLLPENSFKDRDQSSNDNSTRFLHESRNYRVLLRQMSGRSIDESSPNSLSKPKQQQREAKSNSNGVSNQPFNATASFLNNQMLLNTVDISHYPVKQGIPPMTKSKMTGRSGITKAPVEGKVITLHYRENNSAGRINGFEQKEPIALALKQSNSHKANHVGFGTSKEYNKVIDRVFLSTTPHIVINASKPQSIVNQSSRDKRNFIEKELIECARKSKLKYETINKVLTHRPKSLLKSKGGSTNRSLESNMHI